MPRISKQIRVQLDYATFVEALFASGLSEGECKTDNELGDIAFLVEVLGFESMTKLCVAFGGSTIRIPRLSAIAKKVNAIKAAQLVLNGDLSQFDAEQVMKVPRTLLKNMMNLLSDIKLIKGRVNDQVRLREIEVMMASFCTEIDPVLEEVEDGTVVENVDDNCPENGYNTPRAEDDADESTDDE